MNLSVLPQLYRKSLLIANTFPEASPVDIVDYKTILKKSIPQLFRSKKYKNITPSQINILINGLAVTKEYQTSYQKINKIRDNVKYQVLSEIEDDFLSHDSDTFLRRVSDPLSLSESSKQANFFYYQEQLHLLLSSYCLGFGSRSHQEMTLNSFYSTSQLLHLIEPVVIDS